MLFLMKTNIFTNINTSSDLSLLLFGAVWSVLI